MRAMILAVALWALALAGTPVASQNSTTGGPLFSTIRPSTDLIWIPCLTSFFCAMLDVPLDYAKPDGYRASVPLIKLPAVQNSTDGPYQGMILTNPGGPGGSGVNFVISSGSMLQQVTGTNFDIVSFDPRGIGSSLPSANCTLPPTSKVRRDLPKLRAPKFLDSFFENQFALAQMNGAQCKVDIGGDDGAGQHMTTTVNARDMISIVNAFARSPDGAGIADASLLNYWGISYGTFLGQVFANMFPDRIGRVVLDGVVDPEQAVTSTDTRSLNNADEVIATFFVYCHLAGPELCPFYTGESAMDIYRRFENLVLQLDPRDAAALNGTNATVIEAVLEVVKEGMFSIAYSPATFFPILGVALVTVEQSLSNGSYDSILQLGSVLAQDPTFITWETAVSCTDNGGASFNMTLEQLRPYIRKLEKQSVFAGELWSTQGIQCSGWPISGVDRYAGPFGCSTQNPLLFVSNTLDPVTPHINGRKWSSRYVGAQLLTIEAQGHSTLNAENKCGFTKMHNYFQRGELPGKHSHCEQEPGAFNITLSESIEKRSDWNDVRDGLQRLQKKRQQP